MTIYLFDCDNTILQLPYPESIHYMNTDKSLDPSLGFNLINRTKKSYTECVHKNDGPIFLLSNRVVEVENALKNLLGVYGYKFDGCYLIEGEDRNKGNRVKKILKKYPSCKSIKYWEDKDKHIDSVKEAMKDYPEIKLEIIKTV